MLVSIDTALQKVGGRCPPAPRVRRHCTSRDENKWLNLGGRGRMKIPTIPKEFNLGRKCQ